MISFAELTKPWPKLNFTAMVARVMVVGKHRLARAINFVKSSGYLLAPLAYSSLPLREVEMMLVIAADKNG
jgi:hypothetical protein